MMLPVVWVLAGAGMGMRAPTATQPARPQTRPAMDAAQAARAAEAAATTHYEVWWDGRRVGHGVLTALPPDADLRLSRTIQEFRLFPEADAPRGAHVWVRREQVEDAAFFPQHQQAAFFFGRRAGNYGLAITGTDVHQLRRTHLGRPQSNLPLRVAADRGYHLFQGLDLQARHRLHQAGDRVAFQRIDWIAAEPRMRGASWTRREAPGAKNDENGGGASDRARRVSCEGEGFPRIDMIYDGAEARPRRVDVPELGLSFVRCTPVEAGDIQSELTWAEAVRGGGFRDGYGSGPPEWRPPTTRPSEKKDEKIVRDVQHFLWAVHWGP